MTKPKSKLPFDPNSHIFRWGPIPGLFFYSSIFTQVNFKHFIHFFSIAQWTETLSLFENGQMVWICNHDDLYAAGRKVFLAYMLPQEMRAKIYKDWQTAVAELEDMERELKPETIHNYTDAQLRGVWEKFHEVYLRFWIHGMIPELANYGSDAYLEERLEEYVADIKERHNVLEALTAPTRLSFYKEEEINLAKSNDLSDHQAKYFWLKNSYAGTETLPMNFFVERKKSLPSDVEATATLHLASVKKRKMDAQMRYNLPQEIMDIAEAISDGIGWQDERKKYIFIALHYEDVMLREVARRFGYTMPELHNAWFWEIPLLFEEVDLHGKLADRNFGFGVQFYTECSELTSEEVQYFWNMYAQEKMTQAGNEIRGTVACRGNGKLVRGKVRLVINPAEAENFHEGDILVAAMTSPEYIFLMKKASAIVTDTGGLTSHAAIVSRELGIPCIIGTKFATQIFKDGDVAEVDVEKGFVRKIQIE